MPQRKPSAARRLGRLMGSGGRPSAARKSDSPPNQPSTPPKRRIPSQKSGATRTSGRGSPKRPYPSPLVIGGSVIILLLVVIFATTHSKGASPPSNPPSGDSATSVPAAINDVTVDSCQQDPQLDMVALGRITNGTSSAQDYQLFISYFNGDNDLITSSKVQSFTDVAPGQVEEFNVTTTASGTVAGLTCKPEVSRALSSGG